MSYIETNKARFFFTESGAGDPILFLHGFPVDHAMWSEQLTADDLPGRLLAIDLRGFGKSSSIDSSVLAMSRFADDVVAVVQQLELKAVTLCGLSMGGYIAFEVLRRHPEIVHRLILCDTKAEVDTQDAKANRLRIADHVLANGTEVLAKGMVSKLFSEYSCQKHPEIIGRIRQTIRDCAPASIAAAQRGMAERNDSSDLLPQINVPTLVLCGEHDALTTSSAMRQLAGTIPDAEFVEIKAAGHMAPLENPSQTNAAIADFCSRHRV